MILAKLSFLHVTGTRGGGRTCSLEPRILVLSLSAKAKHNHLEAQYLCLRSRDGNSTPSAGFFATESEATPEMLKALSLSWAFVFLLIWLFQGNH